MNIRNAQVANIATTQYTHTNNRDIRGVFETVDDDWFLISGFSLSKLLYESVAVSDMSLEEAEKCYGDEIVRRYLKKHDVVEEYLNQQAQERRNRKLDALNTVNTKRKKQSKSRRMQVLSLILQGYSKDEITESTGIARGTIDSYLRGLRNEEMVVWYKQNEDDVFDGVSNKQINAFITADCNYKKYRKLLASGI